LKKLTCAPRLPKNNCDGDGTTEFGAMSQQYWGELMESSPVGPVAPTWRRTLGEHIVAIAIGIVLLAVLLDLASRDLSVPFHYDGDSLFYLMVAKGIVDTGSPYSFPQAGAPFVLDLHDFANFPPVHVLMLKVLALAITSPGGLLNAYFLLTFPLTIITTLAVLRHFRCAYAPALVCCLLFTFLPYHFLRAQSTLACYFLVPPAIMVVIWLYRGEPIFFVPDAQGHNRFRLWHAKTWLSAAILFSLALSDVYYSFFTCFMLLLAGSARTLDVKNWRPALATSMLIGVVVVGNVFCLVPALSYAAEHGSNHDAMQRGMIDSEHFGLRIAQMLMPITGHRISFVAMVKQKFNTKLIFVSENDAAAMGVMASVGFLILLARLLMKEPSGDKSPWLSLSRLNVFAVLLATIGGFGLLVAAALPQIRSYNRISLFIAFFSLFALALVLQKGLERWSATASGRWLGRAGLGLLLLVGVLDQTPKHLFTVPPTWESDAAFVSQLEAQLPARAMVYQLPYRVFPEGGRYDHLRLFMQSTNLHWSYPVMRSRPCDFWHKELAAKPVHDMVPQLALAGFQGVCIDRSDDLPDVDLEKKLAAQLGVQPVVSSDQRFAFYPLQTYTERMKARFTSDEWQRLHDQTVHPVVVSWLRGFMRTPEMYPKDGRWCCRTGTMQLSNSGPSAQTVRLTLTVRTGFPDPAVLKIDSPLWTSETTINDRQGEIEQVLEVPPGRHTVNFSCDAAYFNDNARRVFRVVDFKVRPEPISSGRLGLSVRQAPGER
jgi:hypothetical protein